MNLNLKPFDHNRLEPFQRPLAVTDTLVVERPTGLLLGSFRGRLAIGAFSYVNQDTIVYSSSIGRYVSIAHRVMIGPSEHPPNWFSSHGFVFGDRATFTNCGKFETIVSETPFARMSEPVNIGNDVWIGYGAMIRKGVTIGDGAIVGAGAIVTKDVAPYTIVGGNPAKPIRSRFDDKTTERLMQLSWWDYVLDRQVLGEIDYSDVGGSISRIEDAISAGSLQKITPEVLVFRNINGMIQCFEAEN